MTRGDTAPSRRKKDAHRSQSEYVPLSPGDAPWCGVHLRIMLLTYSGYHWQSMFYPGRVPMRPEPGHMPPVGSSLDSEPVVVHILPPFVNAHKLRCPVPGYSLQIKVL